MHRTRLMGGAAAILASALAFSGCVDSFDGSKVQMVLGSGVQVPGDDPAGSGRPPSDTHYEIYVVKDNRAFKLFEFEVQWVITMTDPCFIEDEESRYPGLHATMFAERLEQDLTSGGQMPDENEAGDIFLAQKRVYTDMPLLTDPVRGVKAVVSHESGLTDADRAAVYTMFNVPIATDMSDTANASRLAACNAIFAAHPDMYVGNDKVFSLPLNGQFYGVVLGRDPRNNAPLGGSFFSLHAVIPEFDALRVNWNFNDPNDPRKDQFDPSNIGWHYLAGVPIQRTRGVVNVSLFNNFFASLTGEIAIFNDVSSDNVEF